MQTTNQRTTQRVSDLIPGTLDACLAKPITLPSPDVKPQWLARWLHLQTSHHPKLRELEQAVGAFCRDIWKQPVTGRTLVLCGHYGNGKTHCAKAVHRWCLAVGNGNQFMRRPNHVESLSSLYWHWPELLDRFKEGQWDLVSDMLDVPVLIIDELGGGHDPSRVGVDKLCRVLSNREHCWNLITTNILPEAWEEVFDRRVASRLIRNSVIVDLSDVPDFSTV